MNDIDRNPAMARTGMLALVSGLHVARALFVAARLQLADLLAPGPKPCSELAAATATDAFALLRILRLLAAAGVVTLDASDRAALTPLGETLRSDHPQSLRGWVIGQVGDYPYRAWAEVMHSVRTGNIAFDHAFGTDAWSYRASNPEAARDFDDSMVSYVADSNAAVIATRVFENAGRIVDVGGGEGALLLAILAAHPQAVGTVFERPHVAQKAQRRIDACGAAARCNVLEGDAFEGIPGGADTYLLSRVVHDWDDARAHALLRNCRAAMAPGARLVLVERVLPERIEPGIDAQLIAASDVQMMVMNGGRERTEREYRGLFDAAGFRFVRRIPTGTVTEVLEGEAW